MSDCKTIDNAFRAYEACKNNGSEWGMKYWEVVIAQLIRKRKKY